MQSRRGRGQACFFVVGRLGAALTHGNPASPVHPNRRFGTGTVFGFLLAALLVAIFGVYGLFVPGGDSSWRTAGSIVVTKETGARYVYLDGQLRPVLNFSSALLAAGEDATVVAVSRNSLVGVPVGAPIGIPGAPDGLPAADRLDTGPWTVCTSSVSSGGAESVTTTLALGRSDAPTPGGQGLLVSGPDHTKYLVWQGTRYRVDNASVVDALGYASAKVLSVSTGWLNVIPAGADLAAPVIPGVGQPGPKINGQPGVVGQIYEARNPAINSDQLYVLERDGLAPLSRTLAALLLAAPTTQPAYPTGPVVPIAISVAQLAGVPVSASAGALPSGYPSVPPPLSEVDVNSAACVPLIPSEGGGMTASVVVLPRTVIGASVAPAGRRIAGAMADQVAIPADGGALVGVQSAPGAAVRTEYLVTDLGVKYPLRDASVAGTLGYGQAKVVGVTPALLALLPTGPVLDPAAAGNTQLAGS